MHQLAAFIRLSRLYFLPMPVLTYLIGLAAAQHEREMLNVRMLWAGLGIELLVQLSVAYLNDYWDIPTDRINTRRTLLSGGSGELTTGVLSPRVALIAGITCQISAALLAFWIGIPDISWPILVLALAAAFFYTAPPLRLAWRGLGELTTSSVAALGVPMWAYSLQTGRLNSDLLILGLPLMLFIMSLFVAIATPDYDADRRVGKHTLPVIVGQRRIASLYAGLLALAYIASILLWPMRVPAAVLIGLAASVPLALWAWRGLHTPSHAGTLALTWMIFRAGLLPLEIIIVLNLGLRFV